jgi:hypothetical protein
MPEVETYLFSVDSEVLPVWNMLTREEKVRARALVYIYLSLPSLPSSAWRHLPSPS